jgi:hypothetical protein
VPFDFANSSNTFGNRPMRVVTAANLRAGTPHITGLIQGQSHQPQLLILTNPDAVTTRAVTSGSGRKTLQLDCGPNFQPTVEPCRATLGVHQDYQAWLGKRVSWIHTGEK